MSIHTEYFARNMKVIPKIARNVKSHKFSMLHTPVLVKYALCICFGFPGKGKIQQIVYYCLWSSLYFCCVKKRCMPT